MRFRSKKEELFLFLTDKQLFILEFDDHLRIKKDFKIEELISYPEPIQKELFSKKNKDSYNPRLLDRNQILSHSYEKIFSCGVFLKKKTSSRLS